MIIVLYKSLSYYYYYYYLFIYIIHSAVGCTIALSLLMALPIAMVIMGK